MNSFEFLEVVLIVYCSDPDWCAVRQYGSDHCFVNPLARLGNEPPHRSHCSLAVHKSSRRFLGDVVNVSIVVKLVIEIISSYTKELYSFGQSDGAVSKTEGTHCPVPISVEHDDFSF